MRDGGNGGGVDAAIDDEGDDALSSNDPWSRRDFDPAKFHLQIPFGCGFLWFPMAVNVGSLSTSLGRSIWRGGQDGTWYGRTVRAGSARTSGR